MSVETEPRRRRILVASETADDATDIRAALHRDFDSIAVSFDPTHARADHERSGPDVLVLAFPSLERAEHHCRLVDGPPSLGERHEQRVVLVGKEDIRAAFEACQMRRFDDYVVYWPQPHDAFRLPMAVWNACRAAGHSRDPGEPEEASEGIEPTSSVAADSPGHTVLVVEDDPFAAKLIARAMTRSDLRVTVAGDAAAALEKLKTLHPSVILMDINLPGMDGLRLTELLKADPRLAPIPVVMLTGEATRETLERSRSAGAADFIVKPFTLNRLLAKLAPYVA